MSGGSSGRVCGSGSANLRELCLFSDLEQLDVSTLCDGVVRFLQDLPGPVLPPVLQGDLIHTVQGEQNPEPRTCSCNQILYN